MVSLWNSEALLRRNGWCLHEGDKKSYHGRGTQVPWVFEDALHNENSNIETRCFHTDISIFVRVCVPCFPKGTCPEDAAWTSKCVKVLCPFRVTIEMPTKTIKLREAPIRLVGGHHEVEASNHILWCVVCWSTSKHTIISHRIETTSSRHARHAPTCL